ncbi:hypothetical protein ECA0586A [Pectobacterium atrosepticum SCRI1043]|uniref:Uncharacterized protein n=2 Tax=Pectobacterium atrosepticum TaxID=29471 RepID=Q6D9M8_PECAS|nr:hypothetical protein KCQ_13157 [Pectobacterium atrosepticum]CAG73502.1 hypothetical protein ECA0586A [Pectobacterium atrosepticum SCRI1043]
MSPGSLNAATSVVMKVPLIHSNTGSSYREQIDSFSNNLMLFGVFCFTHNSRYEYV